MTAPTTPITHGSRATHTTLDAGVTAADRGGGTTIGAAAVDPSPTATLEPKAVPIPRWLVRTFWRGHRLLYAMSGGRRGLRVPAPERYGVLRLRTIGRRSGQERRAILAYFEVGADLVLVPMNGWAEPEPAWWLNLQARPDAVVDLPGGTRAVAARRADPEERARLWAVGAAGPWGKDMDAYAAGRGRETQVVILEPRADAAA